MTEKTPEIFQREMADVRTVSEAEVEHLLCVVIHRAGHLVDRLPEDPLSLGLGLNYAAGVPESANDVKRGGAVTRRGEKLQREAFYSPRAMALGHLVRPCGTCSLCRKDMSERCELGARLSNVAPSDWTEQEAKDAEFLEAQFQRIFRRWEGRGYFVRKAPVPFGGVDDTAGLEKDAWAASITSAGIDHAREVATAGDAPQWTKHTRNSILWAKTAEQRRDAPQWLQEEFIAEGGVIDGPRNTERSPLVQMCGRCGRWHHEGSECPVIPVRHDVPLLEPAEGFLKKIKRQGKKLFGFR
jgi:hypothetical protein